MNEASFPCPSCGVRFKRASLPEGKRVRCPKCGEIFETPAASRSAAQGGGGAQAGRSEPGPAAARESRAAGRGAAARARGGRRTARPKARGRASPPDKNRSLVLPGLGLVLALAAGAYLAFGGGGASEAGTRSSGVAPGGAATAETPPKPKSPKERLAAILAEADKLSGRARAAKIREAVTVLDESGSFPGAPAREDLLRRILEADPSDEAAHEALGHMRFTEKYPKYEGKWLTKDEYAKAIEEWRAYRKKEAEKAAAEAERRRWTKDAFARKAAKVRDIYLQDVAKVPGLKLKFFFDLPEVPKPYFMMVEDSEIPDPEATAKILGPGLAALRKAFRAGYPGDVLAGWFDDDSYVVPVMIFKNAKSYENYRKHGHDFFPSTGLAAAFYTSNSKDEDLYKGILYVWQGAAEKQFYHEVFHEATHQLMHNSCQGTNMGSTPWLEEGIAEYWGSYGGNRYSGYHFGVFYKGRYPALQNAAQAYMNALKKGAKEGAFLTPKQLLSIDGNAFERMKAILDGRLAAPAAEKVRAGVTVSLIYAEGWGFIYFCNHYKNGRYKKAFEQMLADELRYQLTLEKAAEHLGMKSDSDWDALAKEFFVFILRAMRRAARR